MVKTYKKGKLKPGMYIKVTIDGTQKEGNKNSLLKT